MPRTSSRSSKPSTSKASTSKRVDESDEGTSDSDQEKRKNSTFSFSCPQPVTNLPDLITNFVKYIINYSSNKIPIKRTELSKALNIPQKDYSHVYDEAVAILEDVYGLELAEVPESKSGKMYLVYSKFRNISVEAHTEDQQRERLLLFLILSYIFMKGGEVQESRVFQFIKEIPLNLNFEEREDFIRKLIKDTFSRQLYLKRNKIEIEGKNEPEIHLSWGARADLEYDKKMILDSVSKIMHKSPLNFSTQYSEAHGTQVGDTQSIMID